MSRNTYVSYNGEKKFTWHDAKACCSGFTCSNGVCITGSNYCPDGKEASGTIESCYPTTTTIVTSSGGSCPSQPACPAASEATCPAQTTCTGESNATASTATSLSCSDTDAASGSSINLNLKGTASGTDDHGAAKSGTDICVGQSSVNEFYCAVNGSATYVTNKTFTCPGGAKCTSGQCAASTTGTIVDSSASYICTDTDNGVNTTTLGAVGVKYANGTVKGTWIDTCLGSTLLEYSCSSATASGASTTSIICPISCSAGRCTSSTSSATATISTNTCSDNDLPTSTINGGNSSILGTVSITQTGTSTQIASYTDTCTSTTVVNQSYCTSSTAAFKLTTCPTGTTCASGVCSSTTSAPKADDGSKATGGAPSIRYYFPTTIFSQSFSSYSSNLIGGSALTPSPAILRLETTSSITCPQGSHKEDNICDIQKPVPSIKGWITLNFTTNSSSISINKVELNLSKASSGNTTVRVLASTSTTFVDNLATSQVGTCNVQTTPTLCTINLPAQRLVRSILVGVDHLSARNVNVYWVRASSPA